MRKRAWHGADLRLSRCILLFELGVESVLGGRPWCSNFVFAYVCKYLMSNRTKAQYENTSFPHFSHVDDRGYSGRSEGLLVRARRIFTMVMVEARRASPVAVQQAVLSWKMKLNSTRIRLMMKVVRVRVRAFALVLPSMPHSSESG